MPCKRSTRLMNWNNFLDIIEIVIIESHTYGAGIRMSLIILKRRRWRPQRALMGFTWVTWFLKYVITSEHNTAKQDTLFWAHFLGHYISNETFISGSQQRPCPLPCWAHYTTAGLLNCQTPGLRPWSCDCFPSPRLPPLHYLPEVTVCVNHRAEWLNQVCSVCSKADT